MNDPQRLRILHLTGASDAGGLSRYLLDLCAGLHARGHQVTIAGQRGAWHDRFAAAPWPWIDQPLAGGPAGLWRAARWLKHYLADHPTDVVHTHYRKSTLVARRGSAGANVPILYTVHQPRILLRGPWRWLTDFGDHTHAPSQDAWRWLTGEAGVPADRVTVIAHGVDPDCFPQRGAAEKAAARVALGLRDSEMVAAFVGRLDVPKNPEWMLNVAEVCRGRIKELKILVAGGGPDEVVFRRALEHRGLGDSVVMLGECDALPVYEAADALLSPSKREGFGLVCAEAMCVGVPVLRTQTGGAEEMILQGITGRSTPVDRRQFAEAAAEFLGDRAALEKMGWAAAAHIRSGFTLDRQIDRTIELYRKMK